MSGTRIDAVVSALASSEPVRLARIAPPRKIAPDPPRARVLRNSEATATYDYRGQYPSRKMFQIARPLPIKRAFEDLVPDLPPEGGVALFKSSYLRDRGTPPAFVDALM